MANKIATENKARAARNRQSKLQAAGLLISNAIHALEMLNDMPKTMEQLLSVYNEIKEAQELKEDSSSKSARLSSALQWSLSEKIRTECPVVKRWKNILA